MVIKEAIVLADSLLRKLRADDYVEERMGVMTLIAYAKSAENAPCDFNIDEELKKAQK